MSRALITLPPPGFRGQKIVRKSGLLPEVRRTLRDLAATCRSIVCERQCRCTDFKPLPNSGALIGKATLAFSGGRVVSNLSGAATARARQTAPTRRSSMPMASNPAVPMANVDTPKSSRSKTARRASGGTAPCSAHSPTRASEARHDSRV
jgi:hypothetical protein